MSADGQSSHRRYDCFLSFYGGERLAHLGFSGCGTNSTVLDLAERVSKSLMNFEDRQPSVFYDNSEIGGSIADDIAQAMLKLRGGGVGLVLLSRKSLGRKFCLAEFRAFLELWKLKCNERASGEAIEVRVVCLEKERESVLSELNHPVLKDFFNEPEPSWFEFHFIGHDGALDTVISDICEPMEKYWSDNSDLCLGEDRPNCLSYLQGFFPPNRLSLVSNTLRVRPQHGQTLGSVFGQALLQNKLTDRNLKALSRAADRFGAKDVVCSFRRKWISTGWRYGSGPGKIALPFPSLVEEAAEAIESKVVRSSFTAADPATTRTRIPPSASQPRGSHNYDSFQPYFPDGQPLSDGLNAIAATSLAQLWAVVLQENGGNGSSVGIGSGNQEQGVRPRRVALASVAGEGGVGKTSTCKLLIADDVVGKHFAGGALLWIDVGRDATEGKVKGQVRTAMRMYSGEDKAKAICAGISIDEAVGIARAFFSGYRILVLIDDVWETPVGSGLVSWAAKLSEIASCPGSAVIMTTRSRSVSEGDGFNPIRLRRLDLTPDNSLDWGIAEQVYDWLLEATSEKLSDVDYRKHRRKGLKLSCGLLLAIGTFVGLAKNRVRNGATVQALLNNIDNGVLSLAGKSFGNAMKGQLRHYGLYAAMEESLAHLDEQTNGCVKSNPLPQVGDGEGQDIRLFRASYESHLDKELSSRYAALSMMPNSSTRLSFPVLCRLWHVETVDEAEDIAQTFVGFDLGSIEVGIAGQGREFVLHGLQYEFCVFCDKGCTGAFAGGVGGNRDAVIGHAFFLSSCESLVGPRLASAEAGAEWAVFCFDDTPSSLHRHLRCYLGQNLFRHLWAVAGQEMRSVAQTMLNVVFQFCWIRGRIRADGCKAIRSDCLFAESLLESTSPVLEGRLSKSSGVDLQRLRSLCGSLRWDGDEILLNTDGILAESPCQQRQAIAGIRGVTELSSLPTGSLRLR